MGCKRVFLKQNGALVVLASYDNQQISLIFEVNFVFLQTVFFLGNPRHSEKPVKIVYSYNRMA